MHNTFCVTMPHELNEKALFHLIRNDGQEDLTFALWNPSHGQNRMSALIFELILPENGDRQVHGNVSFNAQYFKRACSIAAKRRTGLCLMHSHPWPGWHDLSSDDIAAETKLATSSFTLTDLPLVGMTVGTDRTWSARIWNYNGAKFKRQWAAMVKVVGKTLQANINENVIKKPQFRQEFLRTRTVYGIDDHQKLASLRYGIVGLGSVGSIVAEQLARIGVENISLIDFDIVKTHNLDRTLGATLKDIGKLKVQVIKRQIALNATAAKVDVRTYPLSLSDSKGYRAALDCDVLFSCVDRPWPRHILNHIAYAHLIPVIDGGIRVAFDDEQCFEGADWQIQTIGHERPCMQCLKTYEPADVSLERSGLLDNPSYMNGLSDFHPLKNNQNIIPFSCHLASFEVFHLMALVIRMANSDIEFGVQRYRYKHGYVSNYQDKRCDPSCTFMQLIATADTIISGLT